MFVRSMLIASAAVILSTAASAGPIVYAISTNYNTFTGVFGTMNLTAGTFNQIGPSTSDPLTGLVPGPNGSLLSLSVSGNLDSINPATGAITVIGASGIGPAGGPGDAAGDLVAFNGMLYATDLDNNLYTVNATTGAATLIGPTGMPICPSLIDPNEVSDESLFTANGKLYATFDGINLVTSAIVDSPELYQINPATGVATQVGPTALGIDAAVQLNGTVYALAFGFPSNTVLSLNLANGNTTFLNNYVSSPVAGGVNSYDIEGVSAVPEPASFALIFGGLLVLLASRKMVRQQR